MKLFNTTKTESRKTRFYRLIFNIFPAYRRTGARVKFISSDYMEIHVQLGLNWATKNYVGTVFGGSIYGALDPIYMLQLMNLLGKNYVVWDKEAKIRFMRPVKSKVFARFLIPETLLEDIKNKMKNQKEIDIELIAQFTDKTETVYAEANKLIYIADKEFYKNKRKN